MAKKSIKKRARLSAGQKIRNTNTRKTAASKPKAHRWRLLWGTVSCEQFLGNSKAKITP